MLSANSPENTQKARPQKRDHTFKIHGNVFDLYTQMRRKGGKVPVILYKRYFVSPEFVQLFYVIHDGGFNEDLFDALTPNERKELSHVVSFLGLENRGFTIALSKMNRAMFTRMKTVEGAIQAGNLSSELRDEYVSIMNEMRHLGMIPSNTASRYITSINRTFDSQKKENARV